MKFRYRKFKVRKIHYFNPIKYQAILHLFFSFFLKSSIFIIISKNRIMNNSISNGSVKKYFSQRQ